LHNYTDNRISLRKIPFVRICIPFIVGILLAEFSIVPTFQLLSITGLVLISISLINVHWYKIGFGSILFILCILFGLLRASQHKSQIRNNIFSSYQDKNISSCLTIKVNVVADKSSETLKPGSQIKFSGFISKLKNSDIPNAFNYKNYLFRRGITHQLYIAQDNWTDISKKEHFNFLKRTQASRDYLVNALRHSLKNDDAYSIAAAILIGQREHMAEELVKSYRNAGAAHIIAVSGLHVGAIALLINWLLKLTIKNSIQGKMLKLAIIVISLSIYSLLTGSSPSVVRASIMFSLLFGGQLFNKSKNSWNNLAIVALLLLLYNPMYIFNISFQFSFLAVCGILLYYPLINTITTKRNKITAFILKISLISIAAQFFLWPLSIYYFNTFPFGFIISNIILIPAAVVLIYGGILLFISYIIYQPLGLLLGGILNFCLVKLNNFIYIINDYESLVISNIWISKPSLVIIYISLLCLSAYYYKKSIYRLYLTLIAAITFAGFYSFNTIQYYRNTCYSYLEYPDLNYIKRNRLKHKIKQTIEVFSVDHYEDKYFRKHENVIEFFGQSIIINPSEKTTNLDDFDIVIQRDTNSIANKKFNNTIIHYTDEGQNKFHILNEKGPFINKNIQ